MNNQYRLQNPETKNRIYIHFEELKRKHSKLYPYHNYHCTVSHPFLSSSFLCWITISRFDTKKGLGLPTNLRNLFCLKKFKEDIVKRARRTGYSNYPPLENQTHTLLEKSVSCNLRFFLLSFFFLYMSVLFICIA